MGKLMAFVLIFVGGMLPCSGLSNKLTDLPKSPRHRRFAKEESRGVGAGVKLVLMSDVYFAVYTILMSIATSDQLGRSTTGAPIALNPAQFVVTSNFTCCLLVLVFASRDKHFRSQFKGLWHIPRRMIVLCSVSELSNYMAILTFNIALTNYDNEGIVQGTRLGLHQLQNFLLATFLYFALGFGRRQENIVLTFASAVLVGTGLYFLPYEPGSTASALAT